MLVPLLQLGYLEVGVGVGSVYEIGVGIGTSYTNTYYIGCSLVLGIPVWKSYHASNHRLPSNLVNPKCKQKTKMFTALNVIMKPHIVAWSRAPHTIKQWPPGRATVGLHALGDCKVCNAFSLRG